MKLAELIGPFSALGALTFGELFGDLVAADAPLDGGGQAWGHNAEQGQQAQAQRGFVVSSRSAGGAHLFETVQYRRGQPTRATR